LKEGFLRERVAQLEAELGAAQKREGVLEADAQKVGCAPALEMISDTWVSCSCVP
jgi:hypothetical protein